MDEARHVIERLERIDRLRGAGAAPAVVLAEVRGLLADGERWLAAERHEGLDDARAALDDARAALERCRNRIEDPKGVVAEAAL